jgi:hypothetical protein
MHGHRESHLAIEIDVDRLDVGLILDLSSRSSDAGAFDEDVETVEPSAKRLDSRRVADIDTLEADGLFRCFFFAVAGFASELSSAITDPPSPANP